MRRIVLATVGVCAVAVVVAALGFAQPAGNRASARAAAASALPPLPAEVKDRGRWNIAVKCDSPPFGYIDVQGKHAGFDVEIAKWFSRFAFGKSNRVSFTCVTTPAREPALTTGRVDLVIATKFPTYFARHPRKVLWLVHQHRAAYELCGTRFSDFTHAPRDVAIRRRLIETDTRVLRECVGHFTIASLRVSRPTARRWTLPSRRWKFGS